MKHILIVVALALVGCGSDPDVILETDPFLTSEIESPPDNDVGIVKRSRDFARQNGMRMEHSTSHFEAGEYSALLKRADINIVVANVGRGRTTFLTAYVRGKPTDTHHRLVESYRCAVFYVCKPA